MIDASRSRGAQVATLAHELGHIHAGHTDPDRTSQYHSGPGGCRGRFEVEAEAISYVVCRINGFSRDAARPAAMYVAAWDAQALAATADAVANGVRSLLATVEFRHVATIDTARKVAAPERTEPVPVLA